MYNRDTASMYNQLFSSFYKILKENNFVIDPRLIEISKNSLGPQPLASSTSFENLILIAHAAGFDVYAHPVHKLDVDGHERPCYRWLAADSYYCATLSLISKPAVGQYVYTAVLPEGVNPPTE